MQNHSETLFDRAVQKIPGGVNSPVRAFQAVGGRPRFMAKATQQHIWDVDGRQYTCLLYTSVLRLVKRIFDRFGANRGSIFVKQHCLSSRGAKVDSQ